MKDGSLEKLFDREGVALATDVRLGVPRVADSESVRALDSDCVTDALEETVTDSETLTEDDIEADLDMSSCDSDTVVVRDCRIDSEWEEEYVNSWVSESCERVDERLIAAEEDELSVGDGVSVADGLLDAYGVSVIVRVRLAPDLEIDADSCCDNDNVSDELLEGRSNEEVSVTDLDRVIDSVRVRPAAEAEKVTERDEDTVTESVRL